MVRASRNILGLVGFPTPGHTQVLLGAVLAPVVRGQHAFPPPHTWLDMDFLLFWLLGSDLRLGRPAILGPPDLRDCRDMGPSPSSRKSSASRADCTEQSCESQADLTASITPYPESHHHQETEPQQTTEAIPVHGPLPCYSSDVPDPAVPLPTAPPGKTKCKPQAPS